MRVNESKARKGTAASVKSILSAGLNQMSDIHLEDLPLAMGNESGF